jgi:uracil permease
MKPSYICNLDDPPPIRYALLYGFQWAMIMFPALIITAGLSVGAFPAGTLDKVYFLQMTLLTSGLFTWFQALWGQRYPLLEGPSTALMLAFMLLAPLGLATLQGGMILGAVLLILTVLSKQLDRVTAFLTPNVVGVPVLLGTMVGFLPQTLFDVLPGSLQIFVGNSLITGIFLVLVLEHLLLRNKKAPSIPPPQGPTA